MFIGHWAPALAVAARRKRPGLGALFIAAQLVDWAFFLFVLLGVEHMRMTLKGTAELAQPQRSLRIAKAVMRTDRIQSGCRMSFRQDKPVAGRIVDGLGPKIQLGAKQTGEQIGAR